GSRAAEIKSSLAYDLAEQQKEREKEQAARDEQARLRDQLDGQLSQLRALAGQQQKSMAQLEIKIAQTRSEMALLNRQSARLEQGLRQLCRGRARGRVQHPLRPPLDFPRQGGAEGDAGDRGRPGRLLWKFNRAAPPFRAAHRAETRRPTAVPAARSAFSFSRLAVTPS